MDVAPSDTRVIRADLSQGIPLPDGRCEVVYHAAVLEHFRQDDALGFLKECHRVLVPGGVIRIGVPDLEQLCHQPSFFSKSGVMREGVYLKVCDGDKIIARFKMVRKDFICGQHWSKNKLTKNRVEK